MCIRDRFEAIPRDIIPRIRVGIVGEIYVKYSPLGNNGLESFLASQGCEVMVPGLLDFLLYSMQAGIDDYKLYGGSRTAFETRKIAKAYLSGIKNKIGKAVGAHGFVVPSKFDHVTSLPVSYTHLPSIMRPEFTDRYAACRHTMPHFHLSMQSGCDRTLASMRRKYNTDSVRKRLEYIRKTIPDAEFSGDVICGFPGESEKDFEETVKFFREAEFLFLHIFPYSIRPGTEAASMPNQLPRNIIRERTAALADIQRKITEKRLNKMLNEEKPLDVLIETVSRTGNTAVLSGHSPQFAEVKIPVSASILHTLCEKENIRENIIRVFPELMENQVIIASLMSNKSSNY